MVAEITIYTDPTCPHCRQLREFLQRKRVSFYEHDVTRDVDAQEFLQSKGISNVPVTCIDEQIIIGFDEERLNQAVSTAETATA